MLWWRASGGCIVESQSVCGGGEPVVYGGGEPECVVVESQGVWWWRARVCGGGEPGCVVVV